MVFGVENEGSTERPPGSNSSRSAKLDGWICAIASCPIRDELVSPWLSVAVTTTSLMANESWANEYLPLFLTAVVSVL